MKKVLILGVASVQYDAIKILNAMGVETYAVAMKKDGPGADEAQHFAEINILDIDALKAYITENQIDLVYSTGSDLAMPVVGQLSEELGLPYFVGSQVAKNCNNKNLMRETLGKDFVGNIPFQILSDKETPLELAYPFIMKPSDSQGQRGVNLIHNQEEFDSLFDSTKAYSRSGLVIIERYVVGPELSVNGYVVDGELKFLEASDRVTWEEYVGLIHKHIVPAKTLSEEANKSLWDIMNRLVKKMEVLNGPIYVQAKVEGDNPYIIEITPRLDGCHMWRVLEKSLGLNLMKLTFEHLLEGKTSELDKLSDSQQPYELEFICQVPETRADYSDYRDEIASSEESFLYYNQGDMIRKVNGKYDKIGYMINPLN